ncbi:MAG: FliM/FliN family flagellar motor switch protein [Deltaproteobacteria bacterium]|nr:FliM/FliN family flagellar motor switch protein [Deltaproteobacteria bacterium]
MTSIRPFTFTNLKRMSRTEVALEATMMNYFGSRPLEAEFYPTLVELLQRYLKEPCNVLPPDMKIIARRDIAPMIPATSCLLVIGAAPSEHKIIVDLDLSLAAFAVERLLGGTGESHRIIRPLTEIEEGVLSFLLLKILSLFHDGMQTGHELALTLDKFSQKLDDVQFLIDSESEYVVLGFRVAVGKRLGYARILIPGSLVTESFGKTIAQSGANSLEQIYMQTILQTLSDTEVSARFEIATLPDLHAADFANLEHGDIIIIENHSLLKTADSIRGELFVRIGAGKNGGLRCRFTEEEQPRAEIIEIVVEEQPVEMPMTEEVNPDKEIDNTMSENQALNEANLEETEGLLRDIDAPVVIELGRIRMNTAQVVRLHKGQVLRLPRGANDPVDLVVNSKLFARGELIEVDGELGVRLIQIIGAP